VARSSLLKNRHREAARTIAIAVALVQRAWFLGALSGEPVFMRTQWERGESPHAIISPGTRLIDPALLHSANHRAICEVESRAPNPGIDHTATERWIGDMSLFNRILTVCLHMRGSLILQMIIDLSDRANSAEDWWDRWRHDLGIISLVPTIANAIYQRQIPLEGRGYCS
jgi:hypothetical protein